MFKQMQNHYELISAQLEAGKKSAKAWKKLYKYQLSQLRIFNHERLIHLLVMLFTGLYTIVLFGFTLSLNNQFLMFVTLATLVLFVCYIVYYFRLENLIQKIAMLNPELMEKVEDEELPAVMNMSIPPFVSTIIDKGILLMSEIIAQKDCKKDKKD